MIVPGADAQVSVNTVAHDESSHPMSVLQSSAAELAVEVNVVDVDGLRAVVVISSVVVVANSVVFVELGRVIEVVSGLVVVGVWAVVVAIAGVAVCIEWKESTRFVKKEK